MSPPRSPLWYVEGNLEGNPPVRIDKVTDGVSTTVVARLESVSIAQPLKNTTPRPPKNTTPPPLTGRHRFLASLDHSFR